VFGGRRYTFSMMNEETDNVAHWDALGEKPRDERVRT